jgi:hypothetical protein
VLATDTATICTPGYTRTVRNVSIAEKQAVDAEYRHTYIKGAQEYDHLIPLELGGSNDIKNLWPQPIEQAHVKDRLENALHADACGFGRSRTVQDAQACIVVDWYACWKAEGKP